MEVQDPVCVWGSVAAIQGCGTQWIKWGSCDLVWGALGSTGWAISLQCLGCGGVMIEVRDLG